MDVLPPELVEEIAAYLSAADVMSCSTVNRQWRQVFNNNNRIWRRLCTFHPQYFKKQSPKVESATENFIEGCDSKIQFFQEMQVDKNLHDRRVHIVKYNTGQLYCDNLLDLVDEVGIHWLIVSCANNLTYESEHTFAVWNMSDEPTLHSFTPTPIGVTCRIQGSELKLINNIMYYLSDQHVLVFEFRHPQYQLNFLSHIRRPYSKELTGNLEEFQAPIACTTATVLAFCYTDIHHRESLVPWVSVYNTDGSLRHKNYATAEVNKVQAQLTTLEVSRNSVALHTCFDSSGSDNVFVVEASFFYLRHVPQKITVRLFRLKTFQYSTLLAKEVAKFICCKRDKEVFIIFYHMNDNGVLRETLSCFNTNGDLLYETQLGFKNGSAWYEIVTAKKGREVLVLKSTGDVTVIDAFQQKHLIKFRVPTLAQNFCGTILNKNLIIIQHYRGYNLVTAIWDYQEGCHLFSFDELVAPCKSARLEPLNRFSLNPNHLSPAKVFAIEIPDSSLARNTCSKMLVLSSF